MANNMHNLLIFKNKKAYDSFVSKYVTHFKNETEEWDAVDFDKIIPAPKSIEECPDEYALRTPQDHRDAGIEDSYFYNWFKWNSDHWSTKWNSYCNKFFPEKNTIMFDTAWCPPMKVYSKLRFSDADFGDANLSIWSLNEFDSPEELKFYYFVTGTMEERENEDVYALIEKEAGETEYIINNAITGATDSLGLSLKFLDKDKYPNAYEKIQSIVKSLDVIYNSISDERDTEL